MELLKRYFVRLAIWSAALFAFLSMAGSGGDIWSAASRMPALATASVIRGGLAASSGGGDIFAPGDPHAHTEASAQGRKP